MQARRIFGFILLLMSPVLLLFAAGLISEAVQQPVPAEIQDHLKGTTIFFHVGRTNTTFSGDCIPLHWNVEGGDVGFIYVSGAPSMGSGTLQHCEGTDASLRIVYDDGTSHTWTVPIQYTFDNPRTAVVAWLYLAPSILCAFAGIGLSGITGWRVWRHPLAQLALALVFATAFVLVLDLFTNSLAIYRYIWDHIHYINMAEHGISGNPDLVSPYAYRPAIPLLANVISRLFNRSVITAFRLIVYAGVISQLVLVFWLARQFTRKLWVPWVVMLVIAVSTYHAKFLLFDVYRPDSLAYSLILIGMGALFRRNGVIGTSVTHHTPRLRYTLIILVTSAFGMLVREFCLIPAALLAFHLLVEFARTRRARPLVELAVVGAVMALAAVLPRLLIPIARSDQFLDANLGNLLIIITSIPRDFNIVLGFAVYLLPLLTLLTRDRVRRLGQRLAPLRTDFILYTLIVVVLTLLGGSDIARFTAYWFVPLIVILTMLLDEGVRPVEVEYMLLATAVYNRLIAPVPMQSLDAYLDFYIVWYDRASPQTWLRALELVLWIVGAVLLRRSRRQRPLVETTSAGTFPAASASGS